jgi:multidrug resistance efflux pump
MEIVMQRFWRENWLVILVIAVMVGGYLFLRTPGDELTSTAEFEAQVTSGTPTVVEFYSNT